LGPFRHVFVSAGRFDQRLLAPVRRIQELREAAEYDARDITAEQAETLLADAGAFIDGIAVTLKQ
jgi:uncharacterized protein (UPF0332 family)